MEPAETHRRAAATNRAFYAAFESLDTERMGAVWLRDGSISCTHPGWPCLLGWGPVMKSWEEIFAGTFGVKIVIADEVAHVHGEMAWVTCTEHIETRGYDGVTTGTVEATNVFVLRDGEWRMVHHHGSPLVRAAEPGETQLQ